MSVRLLAPFGALLALSACVVAPAPFVAVGGYRNAASSQADEAACRQEGSQAAYAGASQSSAPGGAPAIGTRSGNEAAWDRYDQQFAQCMAARGNSGETTPSEGYGYPYGGYGYPFVGGYGYPYGIGFGYPFGGFYGGVYDGFGLGFGYGGYGRFGYGGYGRFGGFGHGGFVGGGFGRGGGFGGHGGGGRR